MEHSTVLESIEEQKDEMVKTLIEFCRIPALGPPSGDEGELKKAGWLQRKIESFGFEVERCDAKDDRVSSGIRPNLIVRMGKGNKRLWLLSHTDIVPPGDLKQWPCDPFNPVVRDGKIYGRGVDDNGQACIATLFALRAIKDCGVRPARPIIAAWVADEETGSYHGAQHLIREGLVREGDWLLAPDWGNSKGDEIEVAEKNILWLKFTVHGKQTHGSTPDKGINAHRAGADLIGRLDRALHREFRVRNPVFVPPVSTFEPTKKEANVPNINTVPGEDILYFDCRILPKYSNPAVLSVVRQQARAVERQHKVKVDLDIIQNESSPPTSTRSPLVTALTKAIEAVRKAHPRAVGIGGGTVAAYFRRAGVDSVVYASGDRTGHSTGEYCRINNLIADSKVFATLALTK